MEKWKEFSLVTPYIHVQTIPLPLPFTWQSIGSPLTTNNERPLKNFVVIYMLTIFLGYVITYTFIILLIIMTTMVLDFYNLYLLKFGMLKIQQWTRSVSHPLFWIIIRQEQYQDFMKLFPLYFISSSYERESQTRPL